MKHKLFSFSLFFVGVLISTTALEIADGKIKLILHENIGRFSLYYLTDTEAETYKPFFTDQDPRTTSLSIVINNKVYRLGDSFSFKESLEKTARGGMFIWRSSQLKVEQEFEFLSSLASGVSDGIKITLTFTNLADEDLEIGTRFILDTNLGEDESSHFRTNKNPRITSEKKMDSTNMADYWVSSKNQDFGLMMLTGGGHVTPPDVVIFANWKRLNDTSWSYSTSSDRNFNLVPYSINDSAVCHYYFPQSVFKGKSTQIVMVMGNYTDAGFYTRKISAPANSDSDSTKSTPTTNNGATQQEQTGNYSESGNQAVLQDSAIESVLSLSIKGDISTVDTVLEEIDSKIENGSYSAKDIELLEKIITELKNKAESYNRNQ